MADVTQIDALGLLCPLPVLKLAKALKRASPGDVVELCADDPTAVIDVPHYCTESGNMLLASQQDQNHMTFRVQKR